MKRNLIFLSIAIFTIVGSTWAEPKMKMNPGKWEITTKTQMEGMGGMPPQAVTHTQCIAAEDAVPMDQNSDQDCKVTDIEYEGNTVSWKVKCSEESGGMEGTGKVTYTGDKMNGTMHMRMPSQNMQMNSQMSGQRMGDCDGSAPSTKVHSMPNSPNGNTMEGIDMEDMEKMSKASEDGDIQQPSTAEEAKKMLKGLFK